MNPETKLPSGVDLLEPAPSGSRQRLLELGPVGFAKALREQVPLAVDRDHVPRRAPVAPRDSCAHARPRRRAPVRRAAHAAVCCPWRPGVVRPTTWPSASSQRTHGSAWMPFARRPAQHRHPDAAARPQHRRLHAVPDRGDRTAFVREAIGQRRRHLPHLRRAERCLADAARDRRRARPGHPGRRGRRLLHRRPARPRTRSSTPSTTTCRLAEQIVDAGRAHPRHQGHGRAAARRCRGEARHRPARPSSSCRCTSTRTTPPAVSWRTLLAASRAGADAGGCRAARRWPARPASRRHPPSWPRSPTPSGTPGCRCRR